MRKEVIKILKCPDCGGKLILLEYKTREWIINGERREEIWSGKLKCERCGRNYPIINGILWIYPKGFMRGEVLHGLFNKNK